MDDPWKTGIQAEQPSKSLDFPLPPFPKEREADFWEYFPSLGSGMSSKRRSRLEKLWNDLEDIPGTFRRQRRSPLFSRNEIRDR